MKTFQDFVQLATVKYKISFVWANRFIRSRLKHLGLSPRTVVCYINWADGDCLTQSEIAKKLNISHDTVSYELMKLSKVWPHLFWGVRAIVPDFLEMQVLSKQNEHQIVQKF